MRIDTLCVYWYSDCENVTLPHVTYTDIRAQLQVQVEIDTVATFPVVSHTVFRLISEFLETVY